ncbi:hypothetical protein [Roseomonas xinghualingensis]|uniref:hypothetical protein n=1 Tax=Roseomonas xinghualingensis TaxID=2986475 RepID=UPI0021F162BE|nr:hypothetical protein [Roseomonas sp. SXEYE001]MCV4206484.1 hypothetical protein [Roseomonas sp. SXEYE001]
MTHARRLAALLPALALGAGLAACAPYPAEPYYGSYATPAPGYAAPVPAYVGQGQYQAAPPAAYAASVDPYCREAYAAAAGAQQQAAISGGYADAARAQRSAGFYQRDC